MVAEALKRTALPASIGPLPLSLHHLTKRSLCWRSQRATGRLSRHPDLVMQAGSSAGEQSSHIRLRENPLRV